MNTRCKFWFFLVMALAILVATQPMSKGVFAAFTLFIPLSGMLLVLMDEQKRIDSQLVHS